MSTNTMTPPAEQDTNGWNEYRRQVLTDIHLLRQSISHLEEKMDRFFQRMETKVDQRVRNSEMDIENMRNDINLRLIRIEVEVAQLKVKAGIWAALGAIAGGIAIVGMNRLIP